MSEDSTKKTQGKIGVQSDNMFPIIKKFLYSDNEIFLRELVSNAVDATQKLKTLSAKGEYKGELGDLKVEVLIEDGKLIIRDRGIGMTAEEIDKYINQIAISGAEDFLDKYKDDAAAIIGHFGLGFYSAFMVAKKVEIRTQSYKEEAPTMLWSCEGSPEFVMEEAPDKRGRGTDIILYIDDDSKEYLEPLRIKALLEKYCRFLPVPIVFGKKKDWKDGKEVDTDEDLVINDTEPIWTKTPTSLKDEDYKSFYQTLYPMSDEPLFWIHLNIDYPFNLTGILYFPVVKSNMDLQKNKIQLYSNQVFVTDNVEGIVPEFLGLLHGVLDSPDIPLNVSRSYLQADQNVKKISSYITRKVADKLSELFKEDRTAYEEKWPALELFVKYGMLTDEKFYEKAEKFALLKNTEDKHFTLEEYRTLISGNQTDKEGAVVYLYAVDKDNQYTFIKNARDAFGYDVLMLDGPLDVHFISMLEQKLPSSRFVRVDSDTLDRLIPKEDERKDHAEVSAETEKSVQSLFQSRLPKSEKKEIFRAETSHQGEKGKPVLLVQGEYMRRMKEMSRMQQGMSFYGEMPDSYNLVVNLDHPLIQEIANGYTTSDTEKEVEAKRADRKGFQARLDVLRQQLSDAKDLGDDEKKTLEKDRDETRDKLQTIDDEIEKLQEAFAEKDDRIAQLIDLGLLSAGLLKGEALDNFIKRSTDLLK